MAERRMFAKTIIDSDAFLDMPVSARLLYYDLGMRADDDGFVNSPKKIMKMVGSSQDDLNILAIRKFIIPFESGIVVIKHWKIHNYIRKDTYNETPYQYEKSLLEIDSNKSYVLTNIKSVDEPSTQVRLGKVSIDKDSINNVVVKSYEENIGVLVPTTAAILTSLQEDFSDELILRAIEICCESNIRNMKYLKGILKDWERKGYKNLADIQNEKREKKNNGGSFLDD